MKRRRNNIQTPPKKSKDLPTSGEQISTNLPRTKRRQGILTESVVNNCGNVENDENEDNSLWITQGDPSELCADQANEPVWSGSMVQQVQNENQFHMNASLDCGQGSEFGTTETLTAKIHRQRLANAFKSSQLTPTITSTVPTEYAVLQPSELYSPTRQQYAEEGSFYGIPAKYCSKVKTLLKNEKGITQLYDWQDECLNLKAVQDHTNLIYSLPTSGGKTLVAEILILKETLLHHQNSLLILPFVAIVQEKVRSLSTFAVELQFRVEEYAGSKGRFPLQSHRHKNTVYIATFEKAHSIINYLLETERLNELGLVVVDELHMIGEGGKRGAILESALAKLLFMKSNVMIVGMSATLGNMDDLKTFLNADVYTCEFRPVELKEYVKCGDSIYEISDKPQSDEETFKFVRQCNFDHYTADMKKMDPDQLTGLVLEVIPKNSCLIFCSSKKSCENVAKLICMISELMQIKLREIKKDSKQNLYSALFNEGNNSICPTLKYTIPFGVAYHHSGLTQDERRLIEEGYLTGTLCCLTCTSTLAAGVNLPARRVILRAPYVGLQFLQRSQYKQMVGRAGRAGIDETGESILLCNIGEQRQVAMLIQAPLETCSSSMLSEDRKGLNIFLLSSIGLKLLKSKSDVDTLIGKTLLGSQLQNQESDNIDSIIEETLEGMVQTGLLEKYDENTQLLQVTTLGKAAFKAGIDTNLATRVFDDLHLALRCLALNSYLHLLFIATPYDMMTTVKTKPDIFYRAYLELSEDDVNVANTIGVSEACMVQIYFGRKPKNVDPVVVDRFYATLVLYDLWLNKSMWEVAAKFELTRGHVQSLLGNATSFTSNLLHFCEEMEELWPLKALLEIFLQRLIYCVSTELIPLMELPAVKRGRARQLYNAGYHDLQAIAKANPSELVQLIEHLPRKTANQIIYAAKLLLIQKADELKEAADSIYESAMTAAAVIS